MYVGLSNLSVQKTIFTPSNNLVLVINRNNPNEEKEMFEIIFKYEEILDIPKYIYQKMVDNNTRCILIGDVAFLLKNKKFVSFCTIFHNEWIYL